MSHQIILYVCTLHRYVTGDYAVEMFGLTCFRLYQSTNLFVWSMRNYNLIFPCIFQKDSSKMNWRKRKYGQQKKLLLGQSYGIIHSPFPLTTRRVNENRLYYQWIRVSVTSSRMKMVSYNSHRRMQNHRVSNIVTTFFYDDDK